MKRKNSFAKWLKATGIILSILLIGIIFLFNYNSTVTDNLDPVVYDLPYKKNEKHKVIQGYGGLFTHKNIAALDFEMEPGTPICAAREGEVYAYKDDSDEGGFSAANKRKANYVIIKHSDGSFGCYWHLQKNGVLIKSGKVKRGQQIGLSGATGQVFKPHLHFSVKRQFNYQMNAFVKTKFKTSDGDVILESGNYYGH